MKLYCILCWHDYPIYLRVEECGCGGFVVPLWDGQELPDMLKFNHRQDLLDRRQS